MSNNVHIKITEVVSISATPQSSAVETNMAAASSVLYHPRPFLCTLIIIHSYLFGYHLPPSLLLCFSFPLFRLDLQKPIAELRQKPQS